jgi:serine/threonine protein kinase SCH9
VVLLTASINPQLLNRNPKHRLGALRDAAELKEHPFFRTIDWNALLQKQLTPPFKPVVESDESTANFDPEFTSADIRDVGLAEMDLDEEDPSEDWVSQSIGSVAVHTYNGPLGSDRDRSTPVTPVTPINGSSGGIQIKQRKPKRDLVGSPLTSSVQENFRGFTYSGGESLVIPPGILKGGEDNGGEEAVDDEPLSRQTFFLLIFYMPTKAFRKRLMPVNSNVRCIPCRL